MPEARVAHVDDLQDGQMKQVQVGEAGVLLSRIDGAYHAVHAFCTHYGAPLADGALRGDRVVCPWHHACFSARTGDHLEPPGLDALERYDVRVDGNDVFVTVPDEAAGTRTPLMAPRDDADDRLVAVVGAGAAGLHAVEALRAAGYAGRVMLITQEAERPYDRPNCSKDYLQGEAPEAWMFFRDDAFYDELDVEMRRGVRVTEVDARAKTLAFADGTTLRADTLILCTGGTPRQPDVEGKGLGSVFTLRSLGDSDRIREAAGAAREAVVVGASFIGMEAAFSLKKLGVNVTVVAPEAVPFERVLGERVGRMIQREHEKHGVRFRLGHTVRAVRGAGQAEHVVLDNGQTLGAGLVLFGIGVRPATDIVQGLDLADDGAVVVDAHLKAADGVYAAGDSAQFPSPQTGAPVRIEHWRLAAQHGRLAGRNAAGRGEAYAGVPFFWTAHFDLKLRYLGHAEGWDEILFDGQPENHAFIAYYVQDGAVRAAAGVGRDREMAALHQRMLDGATPTPEELRARGVTS